MRKVEWFYDVGSGYSFLALHKIEEVCHRYGTELIWRPFLLGGVFREVGNQMPASLPAKATYILKDMNDWTRYYGITWQLPSHFPPNTLQTMRGAYVAEELGLLIPYTKRIFRAFWQEDQNISDPEVLAQLAQEVGIPRERWEERLATSEIKDRLKLATQEAVSRGAFGAPTFFLDDTQMFWGNDRILLLEEALKAT